LKNAFFSRVVVVALEDISMWNYCALMSEGSSSSMIVFWHHVPRALFMILFFLLRCSCIRLRTFLCGTKKWCLCSVTSECYSNMRQSRRTWTRIYHARRSRLSWHFGWIHSGSFISRRIIATVWKFGQRKICHIALDIFHRKVLCVTMNIENSEGESSITECWELLGWTKSNHVGRNAIEINCSELFSLNVSAQTVFTKKIPFFSSNSHACLGFFPWASSVGSSRDM
jgi:hypothetical protein